MYISAVASSVPMQGDLNLNASGLILEKESMHVILFKKGKLIQERANKEKRDRIIQK